MYNQTKLYPRHLGPNVARITVQAGVAQVIFRAGNFRTYIVSDEERLVEYCHQQQIPILDQRAVGRMEGVEAGMNHPDDKPAPGRIKLSDKAQTSLDKVVEKFKSGDLSPIGRAVRIGLDADAPAARWTLSNRVLAFVQTGQLDCRGYRQWQSVGRQVKKGSHSAYILRPRLVKKTGKNAGGEEEESQRLIGFAPVAVFSVEDTEGDPLPEYEPKALPPLADIARKLGIDVTYQPLPPDRLGDYNPAADKIRLATQDEAVFFHELAHAAHKRVDGQLTGGQTIHQETVAEFSAAVLMQLYGLADHSGNAWRYISSYAADPLLAITKALATVEKVLTCLLD